MEDEIWVWDAGGSDGGLVVSSVKMRRERCDNYILKRKDWGLGLFCKI